MLLFGLEVKLVVCVRNGDYRMMLTELCEISTSIHEEKHELKSLMFQWLKQFGVVAGLVLLFVEIIELLIKEINDALEP